MDKKILGGIVFLFFFVLVSCTQRVSEEENFIGLDKSKESKTVSPAAENTQASGLEAPKQAVSSGEINPMQEPASLKQPETALNQENTAASVSISDKPSLQDIQKALKNAGFYKGEVDGVLGPKTKKAIEDFQAENSLIVDGKVGSKTWGKLKTYLNQN